MNTQREVYADSESAINTLRRNKLGVDTSTKDVVIPKGAIVGIKLWGAIDYLRRFYNYGIIKKHF